LKKERSAGVVVCMEKPDGNRFLLLNYPTGHWDFVKGKIEQGETLHQTAVRETKEETGISDLEFVEGFEEKINYNFQFEGELIQKEVVFFLAKNKNTYSKCFSRAFRLCLARLQECIRKGNLSECQKYSLKSK